MDIAYYSEKQKQNLFEISMKSFVHTSLSRTQVSGLFRSTKPCVCGVQTEREGVDTWHESVRFFDIFDATGTLRGSFYQIYTHVNTNVVALG
ncbi:M3 family metallopeptidase [Vibrio lentus]|nr:M3 family metallopeptidase [Vibrio lentus]